VGIIFIKIMMKNTVLIIVCACIVALFCGCQSEQTLIENAAMGYLTAMGNYQIKEAEEFASEETIEKTLHVIEEVIMPNLDPEYLKKNTPATIEIKEVNQLSDTTAEVKYVKTTPIQIQEGSLDMVKQNKEWKAQVIMQLPKAMEIKQQVDSKALDEKYKGKMTPGKPGQVPPSKIEKTE
jgi:glutamyl/glutaminyl-tRNA synthetase